MKNMVNFRDLETAFKYKSNSELCLTWFVFMILRYPYLSKVIQYFAKVTLKYRLPFKWAIRMTAFRVFCSGENPQEAFATIKLLHNYNVKSVLDYVSEGEINQSAYDENTNKIVENIETILEGTRTDFVSLKITGLEDPEFLKANNKVVISDEMHENVRLVNLLNRVDRICRSAFNNQVMVYIDAEETWMQDIIDSLAEIMMSKYNRNKVVVFNTLQMYRKDRLMYLNRLLEDSKLKEFFPGIKLVRGAYREMESLLAKQEGRENPVFEYKVDTDNAFDEAVRLCLQQHNRVVTCIATHNEESILLALECISSFGIINYYEKVQFSQLFGMSDHLTFNLSSRKYHASKYLPYGEVEKAIPYLIRRAEENTSVDGQIGRELDLINLEIKRRDTTKVK